MGNFKLLFLFAVIAISSFTISSCTQEETLRVLDTGNQTLQSRTLICPEPNFGLINLLDSPCAHVKLVYSGTNDPLTSCILKGFQIKIFKTWNISDVKEFNSPFYNSPPYTRYPKNTSWVSTLGGQLVNLNNGPELGVFNVNPSLLSINDSFEYLIESTIYKGPKTWICIETVFECDGEECKSNKCFDAWTPCI